MTSKRDVAEPTSGALSKMNMAQLQSESHRYRERAISGPSIGCKSGLDSKPEERNGGLSTTPSRNWLDTCSRPCNRNQNLVPSLRILSCQGGRVRRECSSGSHESGRTNNVMLAPRRRSTGATKRSQRLNLPRLRTRPKLLMRKAARHGGAHPRMKGHRRTAT